MTNPDPYIPQPPQTLPDKLRAIGWGRNLYTGTQIRDICEEAARALEKARKELADACTAPPPNPWWSAVPEMVMVRRKAAALDWLMREAMDERWLTNEEARTEIQLIIPSRYPARADGDYLEELERAREEAGG